MSFFELDSVVSYDDYVKTIYHHATNYHAPMATAAQIGATADKLMEHVILEIKNQNYDRAYFYCVRCLHILDPADCPIEVRQSYPNARKTMHSALNYEENLRGGKLLEYYKAMIKRITEGESARKRTVALQLEREDYVPTDDSLKSQQYQHEMRRQKLLNGNGVGSSDFMSLLNSTSIPGSTVGSTTVVPRPQSGSLGVAPPLYANYSPPESRLVPSPPKTTVVSTSCYETWRFNTVNRPMTSPRRGIINLGNTCFMNSVLQILNTTPVGAYFLTDDYIKNLVKVGDRPPGRLTNSFSYVIRELRREKCSFAVSASPFKRAIGEIYEPFSDNKQQDANEFLRVLLDGIHNELNMSGKNNVPSVEIDNTTGSDDNIARSYWWQYAQRNSSIIVDLCAFQERSSIECPSCGQVSRSFNPSLGLELPIPKTQKIAIEDCFSAYCREEVLAQDSLYLCARCKNKVAAKKKLMFHSLPKVLFVSLKRFRSYGDFSSMAKVNSSVFFQKHLNLSQFVSSSFSKSKYTLTGIVNHQGNMHGGHYTADACGSDNIWAHISDEEIGNASQPDLSLAYVFCYVRDEC